jgi:hypothetical protein
MEVDVPFKQGRKPSVVIDAEEHRQLRGALLASGYKPHTGPRVKRDSEIQALVAPLPRGRQVHVQEVRHRSGDVAVYAHTGHEGTGVAHAISAITDGASFQGGSRGTEERPAASRLGRVVRGRATMTPRSTRTMR